MHQDRTPTNSLDLLVARAATPKPIALDSTLEIVSLYVKHVIGRSGAQSNPMSDVLLEELIYYDITCSWR